MTRNEWYTPAWLLERVRTFYGGTIDLDPASCAEAQKAVCARTWHDKTTDGLTSDWHGNVWCNPPYARDLIKPFVNKVICSAAPQILLLTNACVSTSWWTAALCHARAVLFFAKRIRFTGPTKGSPTQGQTLFYFGDRTDEFRKQFGNLGVVR